MRTINSFILILLLSVVLFAQSAKGQITVSVTGYTNTTPNLAESYSSLASAITAMNGRTAMSGPVIFSLAVGGTETAPAAGYLLGNSTLNALTSATKTITFQKSGTGTNPLITAFTPGTTLDVDGIWKIQGTDYVTISNIDLQENASNTTSTQQMEWGYAIVKLNESDGSQNININGCTVTLNKANTVSKGIYGGNHIATSTSLLTIGSAEGTNANIKINGCTVSNCYIPISIAGYITSSTYYDAGLEIGTTTGNTISNYGGGSVTANGIYTNGQNTAKIENNTVTLGAGTTGIANGINVAAACIGDLKINANTISVTSSSTIQTLGAILNSAPIATTLDITNNIIQNCNYATATSANFYIIYEQAATTGCTVNITGNTVRGCVYSNAALAGSGGVIAIFKSGGTPTTVNASNNTVNGNTMTGTTGGTFYGINVGSGTTQNINSNNIYNNTLSGTGTGGTIYGIKSTGVSGTVVHNLNNIYNNQITKTTATGNIYGINNASTPTSETYTNNNIYGLSSAGTNTIYGIYASPTSAGTRTVSGNTINSLSSAGGTVYGIYQALSSPNIFQNKIYDLSSTTSTGLVYGIYIKTGTTIGIYDNLISDLRTPAANTAATVVPLAGIYLEGGTTNNVYYNTVYLNGSSTGELFSSAGIYAINTTILDIRNNIFVNTSTPTGAGFTAAYRRSNTVLTNYAATSNYNLFYAGTPGAKNVIFFDGTKYYQRLDSFKVLVTPRETYSVTGDPGLTSITDLTPNPSDPNCWNIRGGAYPIPIASITTDFAGITRRTDVSEGPEDIGAYKFTPSVAPNPMTITGSYGNNATTTLSFAGNTIATITWHSGLGILPTGISALYRPGATPPGTLVGSWALEYLDITASGGTLPYTYNLTLYYNLARTYNITVTDQTNLRVAKYTGSTWDALLTNTTTNTTNRTVTVTGIANGFSSFTFTGNDAPLPVELSSFTSNVNGRNVNLKWITTSEINNQGFEIQRAELSSENLEYRKTGFIAGYGTINTPTTYNFIDSKLNTGKYKYRLKQINVNGNFEYFNLNGEVEIGVPAKFNLSQNYPNPFNPTTKIDFDLPFDSKVNIVLYDISGREIKTLINETRTAGFHTIQFNASDLSSGVYFYRIISKSAGQDFVMTKKMMLLK